MRINPNLNIRINRTFSRQNPDSGHYKFASTKLSAAGAFFSGEKTRSWKFMVNIVQSVTTLSASTSTKYIYIYIAFSRQNPDSGHYKFATTKLSAAGTFFSAINKVPGNF